MDGWLESAGRSRHPGAKHNEWLIDEANADTFPASDPTSTAQPGSLVGTRYAARSRARRASSAGRHAKVVPSRLAAGFVVGCVCAAIVVCARWVTARDRRRG